MHVNLGSRTLDLTTPIVMGVINVTPDSFSDGGQFRSADAATKAALHMLEAGASIIDIGGESTRPGASPMSPQIQLDRVLPVIEAIRRESAAIISIDTSHPRVMHEATTAGAEIINDIFALTLPGAMQAAVATKAAICLMHMQGVPATMQDDPQYDELPGDIVAFLKNRVAACAEAGIAADRLLVDPGFGFGKTDEQNLTLLATLGRIGDLGRPVLVGLSRKGTLGNVVGRAANERMPAGLAAAVIAVERGAHIVRTHDVQDTVDALKIVRAVNQAEQR
jgi:dihydropteroate synthase